MILVLPPQRPHVSSSTLNANVIVEHNRDEDVYQAIQTPACEGDVTANIDAAPVILGQTMVNHQNFDCVKGYAHLESTFSNMSCTVQFRDDSFLGSSPLIPWGDFDEDVKVDSGIFQTFGYGLGVQDTTVCTVDANVNMTLVYSEEYDTVYNSYPWYDSYDTWLADECNPGSANFVRVAKGTLRFSTTLNWELQHGVLPVHKIFAEARSRFGDVDGIVDFDDVSYQIANPFDINGEILFLQDDLINGGQILPAFGKGMDPWHWAHGIGPLKSHEMTPEQRRFEVKSVLKEDRTVK